MLFSFLLGPQSGVDLDTMVALEEAEQTDDSAGELEDDFVLLVRAVVMLSLAVQRLENEAYYSVVVMIQCSGIFSLVQILFVNIKPLCNNVKVRWRPIKVKTMHVVSRCTCTVL